MTRYGFSKTERLSGRQQINRLFEKGDTFFSFPFRIIVMENPVSGSVHQVLVSVPKRHFKKANKRNLLKRRIREAYRLEKSRLAETSPLFVGFVYSVQDILPFEEIKSKMAQVLNKLSVKRKGS